MGFDFAPVYGKDLGSLIETSKKLIAKIESNKFDEQDLKELAEVNAQIIEYASAN